MKTISICACTFPESKGETLRMKSYARDDAAEYRNEAVIIFKFLFCLNNALSQTKSGQNIQLEP